MGRAEVREAERCGAERWPAIKASTAQQPPGAADRAGGRPAAAEGQRAMVVAPQRGGQRSLPVLAVVRKSTAAPSGELTIDMGQ